MEENGKRSGIGCENDDFRDTTVEGLGRFVCAYIKRSACQIDFVDSKLPPFFNWR